MFVKNYYSLIHGLFSVSTTGGLSGYSVKRISGTTASPYLSNQPDNSYDDSILLQPSIHANSADVLTAFINGAGYTSGYGMRVSLGTGDSQPTMDDYTLSGEIISTISTIETNCSRTVVGNISTFAYEAVVKNTGSEPVTVKEIALSYAPRFVSSGGVRYSVLIERTVLAEPITIEPSNTATIKYCISTVLPAIPSV